MKILQAVKKIPGGLMVVPLLLGAIVNTFFGNVLWSAFDGTFTTYLWKSGAMPILAVFIFCNATFFFSSRRRHTRSASVSWARSFRRQDGF